MIIWMLAIVCLGSVGAVGLNRGAIRMTASLIGILVAMMLAPGLGSALSPVGGLFFKNPVFVNSTGVLLAFVLVSIVFKIVGSVIHNKVEVYFKYQATDTKLVRFDRLMKNLGAFVGLINGSLYFFILMLVISLAGYLTVQLSREGDPTSGWVSAVNSISREIDRSGMTKSISAINPMPREYFDASDIVGHLVHNRLLMSRLTRYPEFLDMAEWPEFQAIGNDPRVNELLATGSPSEVISNPKVKAVMEDQEVIDRVMEADISDLKTFIETGVSPRYEGIAILGRWKFDLARSMDETKKANPSYNSRRMQVVQRDLSLTLADAILTATPGQSTYIKALPAPPPAQPGEVQTLPTGKPNIIVRGEWEDAASGGYRIDFGELAAGVFYQTIQGDGRARITEGTMLLELPEVVLVFHKQI